MTLADEEAEKTRKRAERRRKKKAKGRGKRPRSDDAAPAAGAGAADDDAASITSQEARELLGDVDGDDLKPLQSIVAAASTDNALNDIADGQPTASKKARPAQESS